MGRTDCGSRNAALHKQQQCSKDGRVSKGPSTRVSSAKSLMLDPASGRHRFKHGGNAGLESNFTQPGIADTSVEDACPGAVVIVPNHGG